MFTDADALHDLLNPWHATRAPGSAFFNEPVTAVDAVPDVGRGTGCPRR
ncbi:hypothetical protein ACBJ59_52010 [Nonomuraea sp. MTCD27]